MHVPRDAKRDKINTLHSAHCGVLGMGLTPRHSGEKALGWTKCDTKRTPVLGDREVPGLSSDAQDRPGFILGPGNTRPTTPGRLGPLSPLGVLGQKLNPNMTMRAVNTEIHIVAIDVRLFNEIFEGVLLAYDVNILDKNGKILFGIHPYFGVKLKAKLLLFSPKPNMLVEGKVVRLTQASIHVIVLGFSSAIITDQDIREEFNYTTKYGEEVFASRSHKRHVIKVGTMIRFLVKSFDEEILHISGSLKPAHTGSIRWLDKKSKNVCLADSSTTKRREVEGKSEMQDNETVGAAVSSVSNDHQIKKSKKRRVVHSGRYLMKLQGNMCSLIVYPINLTVELGVQMHFKNGSKAAANIYRRLVLQNLIRTIMVNLSIINS
ncbi:SHS2 Rpb7-N domain-containing protein [Citrus sinensis]|nr:SHS2 Rpb7-N domain-containing protein [Citrus sinensis]